MRTILAALVMLAFAGCTQTETLDEDTFTLTIEGAPEGPVEAVSFNLVISGGMEGDSDHIGAHYWNATQSDPMAAFGQSKGCAHQGGVAPDTFHVVCNMEPGTWYVRGHMRLEGDEVFNYWSDEFIVTVV